MDSDVVRLNREQLRCLAHPLRSRLLGALRAYGPATASGLAQRLGTNSGATSYHLRRLAEAGLVTEDEGRGTARERWWRAAHRVTSYVETEFSHDPDDRAAMDWLLGHHLRVTSAWVEDWLATRQEWSAAWRDAADSSDLQLELTAEQLGRLTRDLHAVIERYRRAGPEGDGEPQRVTVLIDAFPQPEPRV